MRFPVADVVSTPLSSCARRRFPRLADCRAYSADIASSMRRFPSPCLSVKERDARIIFCLKKGTALCGSFFLRSSI